MTIISKCEGRYVETEVDGELVLMNTATGRFYALETSALAIWRSIDGQSSRAQIAAALAREFNVAEETVATDMAAFLADLTDAGLIEEKAGA
ncbi:PqqD family protein [Croceicoccus ponticola]|uniref:PqqD family protein n=1 Tax=Croceicoccus ponticola TaxID=2217664 RepID=A0A437GXD5_9SPHN|nr:HPr-rel-A system PqqD family peptide chaperone [Croceicoccus ponticola]RVQ67062.1 PqqD family protein [Croceicoccus ponticola]